MCSLIRSFARSLRLISLALSEFILFFLSLSLFLSLPLPLSLPLSLPFPLPLTLCGLQEWQEAAALVRICELAAVQHEEA